MESPLDESTSSSTIGTVTGVMNTEECVVERFRHDVLRKVRGSRDKRVFRL